MPIIETTRGTIWIADHRHDISLMPSMIIHGAGESHQTFPRQLRELPSANAILPDLTGHGLSQSTGRESIADYALDMIAVIDALQMDKVIVMGHSMGGAIAQWLALEFPDRIHGICLLATGAKLSVNPAIIDGIITETDQTIDMLVKWMFSKSATDKMRQHSAQLMKQTSPQVTQGDYIACNQFDVVDRLSQIQLPALIIGGAIDKMTRPNLSQQLADTIPHAELHLLEDTGHMLTVEKTATVVSLIETWLRRIR